VLIPIDAAAFLTGAEGPGWPRPIAGWLHILFPSYPPPDMRPLSHRLLPSWPLIVGVAAMIRPLAEPHAVIGDPDTYLHIAAGRWIFAHAALPAQDPFSHSMAGAPWVAHEWLSEVILAAVFGLTGWPGLALLTALCFAGAMALLTRSLLRNGEPLSTLILVASVALLAMPHLLARAHTLAVPLLVVWSASLFAARDAGRGPPLRLLPVMMLWANLHGSFMFGLALAGYLGGEALIWPAPGVGRWREVRRWGIFLLLAAIASLVSPHPLAGFLQPFRLLAMPVMQSSFVEWLAPNFQDFQALEVWLLATIFVGLVAGIRVPLPRVLLLLALFHLALQHMRHADLLGFVGPLAVAAALGPQIAARVRSTPPSALAIAAARLVEPAPAPAVALMLLLVAGLGTVALLRPLDRGGDDLTPAAALAAAQRIGLSGPVFNSEGFGGYLIFRGVATFIDGRIEMYGDAFLARYLAAVRGDQAALGALLDRYHIAWTLLMPGDGAVGLLDREPGWRRVYSDKYAVIHARKIAPP
jgi:hypothetical protein